MSKNRFMAKRAENEAIQWLVRLNSPQLSDADEQAFMHWLGASPLHQAAYIKAEELWERGAVLARVSEPKKAAEFPLAAWQGWSLACSAVMVIALVIFLKPGKAIEYDIETVMGEQKTVELQDGSRVVLNTNSRLHITLENSNRHVELLQGEVLFEVKKDGRGFEVNTREGTVRVLGTRFSVYQMSSDTQVTVAEGSVALGEITNGAFKSRAVLKPNERLSLLAAKAGRSPEKISSASELAWRKHQLVFRGQTLNQVIEELGRYFPEKIHLDNPALGQREITAVIPLSDAQTTLTAVGKALGFSVQANPADKSFTLQQ